MKVARDKQLPPGHVTLLIHAYNTGRTTRQREDGETPFEKAADFTLADHAAIGEELYPSQIKAAQVVYNETAVSYEYELSPRGFVERRQETLTKAAAAKVVLPPLTKEAAAQLVPYKPLRDERMDIVKANHKVAANNRQLEEYRRQYSETADAAQLSLNALREHLKYANEMPFGDLRLQVEMRTGPAELLVFDKVAAEIPGLAKQAATNRIYMGQCKAAELAKVVVSDMGHLVRVKEIYEKHAAEIDAANKELLLPFVQRPSDPIMLDCFSKEASPFIWGAAGGAVKDVLGGIAKSVAPPSDKLMQQSMNSLTDPQHEATLRNIRTQATLQDLMSNDDVISGYPANEVLNAFNDIGGLSPRSTDQRMVMQSLLRRRLSQGALDGFEINQLLDTEDRLKRRDANVPTQQSGSPVPA